MTEAEIRADERERCARIVEQQAKEWWERGHVPPPSALAAAIRTPSVARSDEKTKE